MKNLKKFTTAVMVIDPVYEKRKIQLCSTDECGRKSSLRKIGRHCPPFSRVGVDSPHLLYVSPQKVGGHGLGIQQYT